MNKIKIKYKVLVKCEIERIVLSKPYFVKPKCH